MRIDTAMPQAQKINEMAAQPKEVAGEQEHDGDADDKVQTAAKNTTAQQQIKPQEVGNKVDFFA
jgi:hypothetical protein